MDDVRIKIRGMTCQHCQKRVNDAIAALDGVTTVRVDLEQARPQFPMILLK